MTALAAITTTLRLNVTAEKLSGLSNEYSGGNPAKSSIGFAPSAPTLIEKKTSITLAIFLTIVFPLLYV